MVIAPFALIETAGSDDGIKQKSRQFFYAENVNIIFPNKNIQHRVLIMNFIFLSVR